MIARYAGVCKLCGKIVEVGQHCGWARRGQYAGRQGGIWHNNCANPWAGAETARQAASSASAVGNSGAGEAAKGAIDIGTLADAVAGALKQAKNYTDTELTAVLNLVQSELQTVKAAKSNSTITVVELKKSEWESPRNLGVQHKDFATLLQVCSARDVAGNGLNVWLAGPAGTGKTTAARKVAEALGLPFYYTGSIDTQYALMGFVDAHGRVVSTEFRRAYETGGVFLFDEVDGSSPNATLAFNAALANGHAVFPDGQIARHKDFICIAAANTWGLGGTNEYVGRNKLDAAFLDRFVTLAWGVDEALETATCGNAAWSKRVQGIRANVARKGIKVLVTPRASYYGAALLAAGIPQATVEAMTIKKGMTEEQWSSVS